jgi:hypothetical protein
MQMLPYSLNAKGGHLLAIRSKLRGPSLYNIDLPFNQPLLYVISLLIMHIATLRFANKFFLLPSLLLPSTNFRIIF